MSAGLFLLILIGMILLYDIVKFILKLIEWNLKQTNSRASRNKDLYKMLDDIDERF